MCKNFKHKSQTHKFWSVKTKTNSFWCSEVLEKSLYKRITHFQVPLPNEIDQSNTKGKGFSKSQQIGKKMQVLPQRTQRNILSTNGLFKRKMYSYVKLFRYLLPLLVMKTSFYVSRTVYVRVIKCKPLKCNRT